jgi:hypothetical protein
MPDAGTSSTTTTRLLAVTIEHSAEADLDALLATWIEDQALPELLEAAPKSRLMSLEVVAP